MGRTALWANNPKLRQHRPNLLLRLRHRPNFLQRLRHRPNLLQRLRHRPNLLQRLRQLLNLLLRYLKNNGIQNLLLPKKSRRRPKRNRLAKKNPNKAWIQSRMVHPAKTMTPIS
jgi:hypothetical protein